MIVKLYNENTNEHTVRAIVKKLTAGNLIIIPTDTVYTIACSIQSQKAIEKIQKIKNSKSTDQMSILCADITSIAKYAKISDNTFTTIRRNLPGPFTFILPATRKTPEKALQNRDTVGVRVPDNNIALAIIKELGCPLLCSSVEHSHTNEAEYLTDPSLIEENYTGQGIELVVDGGISSGVASTVVDCTGEEPQVTRQGEMEVR